MNNFTDKSNFTQDTMLSGMISSLSLSPSCICTNEAVQLFGLESTTILDVRASGSDDDNISLIEDMTRIPYDKVDIVSGFIQNSLEIQNFSKKTHFIFVCEYGLRSENIVRQLFEKGIGDVYHLCGGFSHHEKEIALMSS